MLNVPQRKPKLSTSESRLTEIKSLKQRGRSGSLTRVTGLRPLIEDSSENESPYAAPPMSPLALCSKPSTDIVVTDVEEGGDEEPASASDFEEKRKGSLTPTSVFSALDRINETHLDSVDILFENILKELVGVKNNISEELKTVKINISEELAEIKLQVIEMKRDNQSNNKWSTRRQIFAFLVSFSLGLLFNLLWISKSKKY